jgi:hypothetical protein
MWRTFNAARRLPGLELVSGLAASWLLCGCLGPAPRIPGTAGEAGATLPREVLALWDAHGGAGAWRDRAAIRFRYRLTAEDGRQYIFPELRLRPDEPRYLWLDPAAGGDPVTVDLEGPPGSVWSAVEAAAAPGESGLMTLAAVEDIELALRALPCFLGAPLSAARGRWEFRTLVSVEGGAVPSWVEVMPRWPSAVGPILLEPGAEHGLLARALYGVRFPQIEPRPRVVTFEKYADFAGVRLATLRVHAKLPGPDPREPRDPYATVSARLGDGAWLLHEEVGDLRFLSREEAEARCPLPEPESEELQGSPS